MNIGKHTVATIEYELWVTDGENEEQFVEKTTPDKPMVALFGVEGFVPMFEEMLNGKVAGDKFDFTIPYDEAYGDYDEDKITSIPKNMFVRDGKVDHSILVVGKVIPLQDQEGNHYQATILSIGPDSVEVDLNHPLAGYDLHFTGKVIEVRAATAEEIDHGHVHGPGGHHH